MGLSYIPAIRCAKCGRVADGWARVQSGNSRFIRVSCHGKRVDIPFAADPGEVVTLFEDKAEPEEPEPRMSKMESIADRIATKKLAHDAKADEWAKRLDALDAKEPLAFAHGDSVIAEREYDLAQFDKTIRTISNLPLGDSDKSLNGSDKPITELPA